MMDMGEKHRIVRAMRDLAGAPTPVDSKEKCWFCGGGLGHPSDGSGHRENCPWVVREDIVQALEVAYGIESED
jgi:hypothetical protein